MIWLGICLLIPFTLLVIWILYEEDGWGLVFAVLGVLIVAACFVAGAYIISVQIFGA